MKFSRPRKFGFTLIELLVVIAIIGILAVLLFPAIRNGIMLAKAVKVANNGKQIVTQIISENLDREVINRKAIWPESDENYRGSGSQSTQYLDYLVRGGVENIDYTFMAGAGISVPGEDDDFDDEFNAWSLVLDVKGNENDSMPFLITKNVVGEGEAAMKANLQGPDRELGNEPNLDSLTFADYDPFGEQLGVFVTKGATAQRARNKFFTSFFLFSGMSTNDYDHLDFSQTSGDE